MVLNFETLLLTNISSSTFDCLCARISSLWDNLFVQRLTRFSRKKIFLLLLTVFNSQESTYDRSSLRVNHRVCCERAEPALRTDNGISFVLTEKKLAHDLMERWKHARILNRREWFAIEGDAPLYGDYRTEWTALQDPFSRDFESRSIKVPLEEVTEQTASRLSNWFLISQRTDASQKRKEKTFDRKLRSDHREIFRHKLFYFQSNFNQTC